MRFFCFPICFLITFTSLAQDWKQNLDQGMAHYKNGRYREAENLFLISAQQSAQTAGKISVAHITALSNAAYAQQMLGDFEKAFGNFRQALALTRKLHREVNIDEIEATINLANAFLPAGLYDSSEYYLARARDLVTSTSKKRPEYYNEFIHSFFEASINIQNSIASLYYKKGLTRDAIVILEQQRSDIRSTYPNDYRSLPMYQNTINNLATYYFEEGESEKAKPVVEEQVFLSEGNPEKERDYLYALNNLGSIFRMTEKTAAAMETWNKALAIMRSGKFANSDLHISILNNMGEMAFSVGDYQEALRHLKESMGIQRQRAAINPRIYQATLLNLSETFFWMGNLKDADEYYQSLSTLLVNEILNNFTYLSDNEKISFYRSNLSILEYYKYFSFEAAGVFHNADSTRYISPDGISNLFDLLLSTKGLILHPGYRLRTSILQSRDPAIKSAYERWEKNKYEYAALTRSESIDRDQLSRLLAETEAMEKWLRSNSSEFRRGFVMEQKTWRDIQEGLLPGEAAVEIVRLADGLVYGALVVTPETTDGPVIALVKSTKSLHLEKQYYKQYANCISHNISDTLSHGVYWQPVLDVIRQHTSKDTRAKRIYLSPDGIYNRINLNTLFNPETGAFVIEESEIHLVTNLKDILARKQDVGRRSAVLLGRPRYFITRENDGRELPDLAGTEREIDEIHALLKTKGWTTTVLKDLDASEMRIKSVRNPFVLHLATHGFSSNQGNDASSMVHDLLNSGIILAGGGDKQIAQGEDGVLTAYEIMNVNLDSTGLVVLSACETGLGEFHTGEGIYGLQAALRSAGAGSILMSLWKVDDTATQQLMVNFYRHWLNGRQDPRSAFLQAQRELKKSYPDPSLWGAFVMTGK